MRTWHLTVFAAVLVAAHAVVFTVMAAPWELTAAMWAIAALWTVASVWAHRAATGDEFG